MEGLGLENIFGEAEIENLFMQEETPDAGAKGEPNPKDNPEGEETKDDETNTTTEVDPDDLFGDEGKPESVGSGEEGKGEGGSSTDTGGGTSPNVYSSIANAMAEDGIFLNLDEEAVGKVVDAETLSEAIENEINSRLDEKQQRISKALENGVKPDDIRMYEATLNNLANIKDTSLTGEDEKAEQLRYSLIYQDFVNKGMKPEVADKYARRSIENGNDVEDAKEALQNNKEYFQKKYDKLLEDAQKEADKSKEERKKQNEKLRDSMLKDKTLMGDIEVSADIRKKAFETLSKPVYKDPETGEYMTALQKYQQENGADFIKYVSLFYTMTNGFKDFDGLVKGKVKKEVRKGLSELEKKLNGTKVNTDGSLRMVTSVHDDPNSYLGNGLKLDI